MDEILHCLREIAFLLNNLDEPRYLKTRDAIQKQCNKIWVETMRGTKHNATIE